MYQKLAAKRVRRAIDPDEYAASGTEHSQQTALFMWACSPDNPYVELLKWMHAIPNGGKRSQATAAILKAEGVKRGIGDVFLPLARGDYHGLYLEMKRPRTSKRQAGTTSDVQDDFKAYCHANLFGYAVCYTYADAKAMIISYVNHA